MEPDVGALFSNGTFEDDDSSNFKYGTVEVVVLSVIFAAIITGTIVGNILVCTAIVLVKKLRKPYNYLLVSLAVSDLCVAILVMPMATYDELKSEWLLGRNICNMWVSFDVLSCTASILNLCMISVDRYNAITNPLAYTSKRTPKRMLLYVVVVWLGAACISLTPFLFFSEHIHTVEDLSSGQTHKVCLVCQDVGYQVYATLCSFYIPLTVMVVVYYKIFLAARKIVREDTKSQENRKLSIENEGYDAQNRKYSTYSTNSACIHYAQYTYNNSRKSNDSQTPMLLLHKGPTEGRLRRSLKRTRFLQVRESKASITLGIIMSAFTVCWLPFFILALVRPFLDNNDPVVKTLSSVFLWLGYTNSLLNPIIYATLNKDFRKPFKHILFCRCGSLKYLAREDIYISQYANTDIELS